MKESSSLRPALKSSMIAEKIIPWAASALFAAAYTLTPVLYWHPSGSCWDIFRFAVGLIGFFLVYTVSVFAIRWYHTAAAKKPFSCSARRIFLITFALSFTACLCYQIIYYPSVSCYDTISILEEDSYWIARQHPWFYCFCLFRLKDILFFFGRGYEAVLFAACTIQAFLCSAISAHWAAWLHSKRVSRAPLLICIAVYALCPILDLHMVTVMKDVPFSYMLPEWIILLYDLWESNGESLRKPATCLSICVCLVLALLRNNGVYVSAFILLCMLLFYFKYWKRILCLFAVLGVVVLGSVLFERTHSVTHLFKETVGIPLQQVSATIYNDGSITEEQRSFLEQLIPFDYVKEHYDPYSSDEIKWKSSPLDDDYLDTHKGEFLKVWAEMALPNLKIYLKAHLQNTYSYWSLAPTHSPFDRGTYVGRFSKWIEKHSIDIQTALPESIEVPLEHYVHEITNAWGEGQIFWLFVLFAVLLRSSRDKKIWIVAAPGMGIWLTVMLSAPVACQWRYILAIALMLPLLFGLITIPAPETKRTPA